jgi:hypothetical protein
MATCESRRRAVTIPVCFAWGPGELVEQPGRMVWRMGFEMLPGGTNFNAQCVRHGIVACQATEDLNGLMAEPRWHVAPGTKIELYAAHETTADDLKPFVDEIVAAFKAHLTNIEQTA